MANPKFKAKRSSVGGKVPATTQLERGEFAINSYDGKVYILEDKFSVGIATTTVTVNPWEEPNGVGAGVSYSSDVNVLGVTTTAGLTVGNYNFPTTVGLEGQALKVDTSGNLVFGAVASGAGSTVYQTKQVFTATEGQTTFTPDTGYTDGFAEVYLNGVRLTSSDYTADDETTVVLSSGATAGDEVEIVNYAGASGDQVIVSAGSTFSGNYNHLYNKPTIPTNNNQLTNGAGYITAVTDQLSVSGIASAGQVILDGTLFMNGGASVSSIQSKTTNGSLQIKVLNQGGGNSAELIQLRGTGNLISANFRPDSGVQLYGRTGSNSAAIRLQTNSTGVDVTGNITVSGTVDGRDVATDGTKLDGIEASADVTDATNVAAAGAVMESDTSTANMSFVVDEDNMASNSATKVPTQQSVKAYVDANAGGGGGGGSGVSTDAQGNTYAGDLAGGSFDGTNAQYNTLYGYDAGGDITTGDYNTCIGWTAGDKITTGSKNVAVGAEALDFTTTGSRNVAVGWEAGRSISSGNRNTCIGDMAGRSLGSASDVVAIGYHAASNFSSSNDVIAIGSNSAFLGGTSKIAIGENSMSRNTDYCIGIGQYTGRYNTGDYSIFMGYQAGQGKYFNGEQGTGSNNILIGYQVLKDCWGAYDNTIIGTRAGIAITESHSTVAIGVSALKSATSGAENVVIGALAAQNLTTGGKSVYIGGNAGSNVTTLDYGVAIGYNAGLYAGTEYGFTAIGYEALKGSGSSARTTSFHNTAIGYQAGHSVINGSSYNCFFGYKSGEDLTSGTRNQFYGYMSGRHVTTGSNNICIGHKSGSGGTEYARRLTTGDNNIVIGHNAEATSSTVDNEITLGNTDITKFRVPGIGITFGNNTTLTDGHVLAYSSSTGEVTLTGEVQCDSLDVDGSADIAGNILLSATNPSITWNSGGPSINLTSANTLDFATSGTNRLRITNVGDVRVKDFSPRIGAAFSAGSGNFTSYFAATGTGGGNLPMIVERYNDNGVAIEFKRNNSVVGNINVTTTSTNYVTSSDYRLKENVLDLDGAITRVKQLSPKRFNFIADADTTVDGFLAHEAATVVPESVTGTHNEVDDDDNPVYQGIDQSKLVPLLTAALQEAIAKIETLETKVAALEDS